MNWLRRTLNRLRSSVPHAEMNRDLDAEMASHLDMATEENMRRGMSEEEARRQALVRFGGVNQARQKQRDARGLPALDILRQDLRYAFRTLRRDHTFTLVAVLVLGLGIGANVAVFSVVNTILLRPLPFDNPQELVWINDDPGRTGLSSITYSADAYQEYQRQTRALKDITGYFAFSTSDNVKFADHGRLLPISGISVADNFFQTLGVHPQLGRLFTAEECLPNGSPAVLLGHGFWQQQFAADPNIVGRPITLDGKPVTVVGILPESFDFGSVFSPGTKMDVYTPVDMELVRNWGNTLALIGRLKPGVTVAQAQAEADLIVPKFLFSAKHPEYGTGYTAHIADLKEYVSGKLRRSLIVLWSAVGLILLIVCVNLSNLTLVRASARNKEFAMRGALGAGRARLIRQLVTESLVLSGAGAVLGLVFAYAITSYLAHQNSIALPLLSAVRVDVPALAWTLLIALATGILFGLVAGLRMSSRNLQDSLKDTGPGLSEGRKHERLRSALVISELALACVLLIGAGLLLRSFLRVLDVDLGFEPERAAAIKVAYDDGEKAERRAVIFQEILARVGAIPGIQKVGISDNLPLDRNRSWGLQAKGHELGKQELGAAFVYVITPGYLDAIGMRLVAGRDFTWHDDPKSEAVVVLNQTAAAALWPGQDPIGRIALVNGHDTRVVGVVADVKESSLEKNSGRQMYLPATQNGPSGGELVVRATLPPDVLARSVMETLRSLNPEQPAMEFRPIRSLVATPFHPGASSSSSLPPSPRLACCSRRSASTA